MSEGGLLAIAGVLMQVLLRNPLAEPYILGSSGGAAVAALFAMIIGLSSIAIDIAAFGGAMAATLLVFSIARGTGSWAPARLLLTGVVLAAGFSAATTLLLALSPDQNLRGMLYWLMGDLSFAYEPQRVLWLLIFLVIGGTLTARHLNVLSRGELQAAIVGMPVTGFRYIVFVAAALATAKSLTTVRVIGYIGMVVPHVVRLVDGSDSVLNRLGRTRFQDVTNGDGASPWIESVREHQRERRGAKLGTPKLEVHLFIVLIADP